MRSGPETETGTTLGLVRHRLRTQSAEQLDERSTCNSRPTYTVDGNGVVCSENIRRLDTVYWYIESPEGRQEKGFEHNDAARGPAGIVSASNGDDGMPCTVVTSLGTIGDFRADNPTRIPPSNPAVRCGARPSSLSSRQPSGDLTS